MVVSSFNPDGENKIPISVLTNYKQRTIVEVLHPRWMNSEHTMFDAEVLFQELAPMGHVPFTALQDGDTEHGREIWNKGIAGEYGAIAAFVAPPKPVPDIISRRQFFQQLAAMGIISNADALAAMQTGFIPAPLQAIINTLPPETQFEAQMLIVGADSFNRTHPLSETVRIALGWTVEQKDDFWRAAANL